MDDESDDDESESVSSDMCSFPFSFDNSVGLVCGLGYGVLVPTEVDPKCEVFAFVVLMPIGVEYNGVLLIEMFWRSNS